MLPGPARRPQPGRKRLLRKSGGRRKRCSKRTTRCKQPWRRWAEPSTRLACLPDRLTALAPVAASTQSWVRRDGTQEGHVMTSFSNSGGNSHAPGAHPQGVRLPQPRRPHHIARFCPRPGSGRPTRSGHLCPADAAGHRGGRVGHERRLGPLRGRSPARLLQGWAVWPTAIPGLLPEPSGGGIAAGLDPAGEAGQAPAHLLQRAGCTLPARPKAPDCQRRLPPSAAPGVPGSIFGMRVSLPQDDIFVGEFHWYSGCAAGPTVVDWPGLLNRTHQLKETKE